MPLSEEDLSTISRRALLAGTGDIGAMQDAYALGVERARVVKPLELIWNPSGFFYTARALDGQEYRISRHREDPSKWWTWLPGAGNENIAPTTLDEAVSMVQQHHAARVLALLVAP